MPRVAFVDGRFVRHAEAAVHVEDRGLQFADSAYEVVALIDGRFADARGHLDRLERSLHELKITMPVARRVLVSRMRQLVARNKIRNGALYIQVTRGQAPRDFLFPHQAKPTLVMTLRPAAFDIATRKKAMKKIVILPDIRWQRRDIKTTSLLAQVLAKQAAVDSGADDAWMVDDNGYVTEASASNAWIVTRKGELVTRPVKGNAILKGVTRNAIQSLCAEQGLKLSERAFTVKEAAQAREAFMSSAVALIVPVSHINGKKIGDGKIGVVTEKIFDLYMDYVQHRKEKGWTAV